MEMGTGMETALRRRGGAAGAVTATTRTQNNGSQPSSWPPSSGSSLSNGDASHHSGTSSAPAAPFEDNKEVLYDRTSKVAKMRYNDHGTHGKVVLPMHARGNVLKKLVYSARETYGAIEWSRLASLQREREDSITSASSTPTGGGKVRGGGETKFSQFVRVVRHTCVAPVRRRGVHSAAGLLPTSPRG